MLLEDSLDKEHKPDNIDLCLRAAGRIEKRLGRNVSYGNYMGLYHDKKTKIPRKKISRTGAGTPYAADTKNIY